MATMIRKFLVQLSPEHDWKIVEGQTAEDVAEKSILLDGYDHVTVVPYEPLLFGRGVKRLNPRQGCVALTGGLSD